MLQLHLGSQKSAHPGEHHPGGVAAHATCVPARAGIQTTLGASAPPNGKKGGAGAEDAHKVSI